MTLDVTFVDLQSQPAAIIELKTSHEAIGNDLGRAYGTLAQHLQSSGTQMAGPPFAIYNAMDGDEWTVTAGYPVATPITAEGTIKPGETPGGRAAQVLHVGPYDKLGDKWRALERWAKENGHSMTNVAWESYIDDPDTTDPTKLRTLLYWHV